MATTAWWSPEWPEPLRDGGRLALSAFNAYFAVRYHEAASFDAATGVSHERTDIRSESGEVATVDLWTGCYTPRELRLLLHAHDFRVDSLSSVEPGAYALAPATVELPEFLVLATRLPRKMLPNVAAERDSCFIFQKGERAPPSGREHAGDVALMLPPQTGNQHETKGIFRRNATYVSCRRAWQTGQPNRHRR